MYGKLFNNAQDESGNLSLFASFGEWDRCSPADVLHPGGLLMKLKGDQGSLDKLRLDSRIYLLIRKVK